jgi:hypothetical protein
MDARMLVIKAKTGDDLLTALAGIAPSGRKDILASKSIVIIRETVELCGIDSEGLGRNAAIAAIIANF